MELIEVNGSQIIYCRALMFSVFPNLTPLWKVRPCIWNVVERWTIELPLQHQVHKQSFHLVPHHIPRKCIHAHLLFWHMEGSPLCLATKLESNLRDYDHLEKLFLQSWDTLLLLLLPPSSWVLWQKDHELFWDRAKLIRSLKIFKKSNWSRQSLTKKYSPDSNMPWAIRTSL